MQYDLSSDLQRQLFITKVKRMLNKGCVVEITERTLRTKSQNSYLHLLLGVLAMETGNTLEYCKEWYYKRTCNPDLFIVKRRDNLLGEVEYLRSSAELTKEETSMAIDRLKRWSSEQGIYLPSPGDEELLRQIAIDMGRMKNYIGG